MRHEQIDQILNMGAAALGFALMLVGWTCSAMFFDTLLGYWWVGLLIIVAISILEFLLTLYGTSLDKWIVGAAVCAYIYDILSNIGGLAIVFKVVEDNSRSLGNIGSYFATNPFGMVICIFLGLFLAVLPERLLRLGLSNLDISELIDGVFRGEHHIFNGRKQSVPNRGASIGYQKSSQDRTQQYQRDFSRRGEGD